jgi:hypothetical protein
VSCLLSTYFEEIRDTLAELNVRFKVKNYFGNTPYCDGWVNLGNFQEDLGESEEELMTKFLRCHMSQYPRLTIMNGRLHQCITACALRELEQDHSGMQLDYVPLLHESLPFVKKTVNLSKV